MKYIIELFEWGFDGEFKQQFFVSPLLAEEVFKKLSAEQEFGYTPRFPDDKDIGYFVPFKIIKNKLIEWGFERVEIWFNTAYVTHLAEFLSVDRDVDADTGEQVVTVELKRTEVIRPYNPVRIKESKIKRGEPHED